MNADAEKQQPQDRQHDMGGEVAGAIDTEDHGMLFWEKQANGMRMACVRNGVLKLDEMRRGAENLPDYDRLSYFERAVKGIRNLLLEKGVFTETELDTKMAEIRRRFETDPSDREDVS